MQDEDHVPISKILSAVSAQLDALGLQVTHLENHVAPIVTPGLNLPRSMIQEMQALDRVRQGMQDLAAITGNLAKNVGTGQLPRSEIDKASAGLQLTASRAALKGEQEPDQTNDPPHDASNLTLF